MKQKITRYFKKLFKILKKPEMAILPSNIAFNIILAIIPILTILTLIVSSFDISPATIENLIINIMPSEVSEIIIEALSTNVFDKTIGISNLIAFILASNGACAIITSSDTLYKINNKDNIKKRIKSAIILIIIITLLLFLVIVPIFGETIINIMHKAEILEKYIDEIVILYKILKWPFTLFIIFFNIKLVYTISPSKRIKSKDTTYGALFTTTMWIIATLLFKLYIEYIARYDILYGNLSSLIILFVWCYVLSYIFVLGLAINATKNEKETSTEDINKKNN